jgi:thioredoxin-related protein
MRAFTLQIIPVFLIVLCACGGKSKVESRVEDEPVIVAPPKDDRPPITISLVDGQSVKLRDQKKKMVITLFQPDCDHCQDEAKQIQQRLEAFKEYDLYFVSSEERDIILQFAKDYKLINQPNVYFGIVPVDEVLNHYGSISTPSMYIYKETGELVQNFDGLVDIEVVIKYL